MSRKLGYMGFRYVMEGRHAPLSMKPMMVSTFAVTKASLSIVPLARRIAMVRCNLIAQLAHREPRAIVNRQIRIELRQLKGGYITTTAHSVSMSLFAHLQTHGIA